MKKDKKLNRRPPLKTSSSNLQSTSEDRLSALQLLLESLTREGILLSEDGLKAFGVYLQELLRWNQKGNLTAITSPKDIVIKHFLDSLLVVKAVSLEPDKQLIDIGTGAGFPGIPLKILQPSLKVTLVDSQLKRIRFLEHLVRCLELKDTQILHARAEVLGQDPAHREQYDYATARAVAELPVLLEYSLPLVKVGGLLIALKGPKGEEELAEASYALVELGGVLETRWEGVLPGGEGRRLIYLVRKVFPTPLRYPRKPGEPAKKPLKKR